MSCSPPDGRVWSRRHKLAALDGLDPVEIDGTWDFKWRKDSTIRLAFQMPPREDPVKKVYRKIIKEIVELAGRWQTKIRSDSGYVGATAPQVPLTLHFLDKAEQHLPAPPLGWATGRQPKVGLGEAVRYDVLISLATLPLKIPEDLKGRSEQDVILPRSELGRYARRFEYGTPTAFMGTFHVKEASEEFWETPEWRHVAVHEIGHILGLAHPYQQHNACVRWKPDAELKRILPKLLRRHMTEAQLKDYIDRQLKAQLPAPGEDGTSFSDLWVDPRVDLPSVMNPTFVQALVEGASAGDPKPPWREDPTEADLTHLRSMYTSGCN